MKFQKDEKVNVLVGKYKGENVHIFDIHIGFNPVHYSCRSLDGKELLFREDELQSIYQHDMQMLEEL